MPRPWNELLPELAHLGLNTWGVAEGAPYAELLPGCRSAVVLGSGGPRLWERLLEDLRDHPAHLREEPHPLDAFVRRALLHLDPDPGPGRRWLRCALDEEVQVDFRTAALRAGLGWPSRLGLLLHPEHGPWLGLRALCLTTEELRPTGPRVGEGPCGGCPAPCATACPAGAILPGPLGLGGGWSVGICASWHERSDLCHRSCASRLACPQGALSRYPPDELRYHYDRRGGREALRQVLGLEGDAHEGIGPAWASWSDPKGGGSGPARNQSGEGPER